MQFLVTTLPAGIRYKSLCTLTKKGRPKEYRRSGKTEAPQSDGDVIAENGTKDGSWRIEEMIVSGEPADEILRYAEENKFDLIFLGYKSFNLIEQILVGSTADKVIRYATCSVLIYRPDRAEHIDI